MSTPRFLPAFSPTPAQAAGLAQEVLDCYGRGGQGLSVLARFTQIYYIGAENPPGMWHAATPFVACDEALTIHWVHPLIHAHLDAIPGVLIAVAMRETGTPEVVVRALAPQLYRQHRSDLERLAATQAPSDALCATIAALPPARDVPGAAHGLYAAMDASGLDAHLALELAEIVLCGASRPMRDSGLRPLRLARLIAQRIPPHTPAPSTQEAQAAYLRVIAPATPTSAHSAIQQHTDIQAMAAALAHGLYPKPIHTLHTHPTYVGAILERHIAQGLYDERHPARAIAAAIGKALHATGYHLAGLDTLLATANARLETLGHPPLSVQACTQAYADERDSPHSGFL